MPPARPRRPADGSSVVRRSRRRDGERATRRRQAQAQPAIATNGLGDLYLALGDPDGQGGWVLRAYYNPLVPWIWFGAILAALGGLVSLSDRRLRLRLPAARASLAVTSAGSGDN
ncbi:MAG TPA: cytochrome c-type biogenesis CcmF C-terminal domain-containing protein [Stellaceae bacterium]|nr:cytochrome c-type biogenesis CcmF C-terminal domain-containing protein [Stellaceae bacterium]